MGINPPSLYAAFGNKETLFREALDRYEALRDEIMAEAFAAPTAREAMTRLLGGTADRLSDKGKPRGCLMVQGALCGGEECETVKRDLASRRAGGEALDPRALEARQAGRGPSGRAICGVARLYQVMQGKSFKRRAAPRVKELGPSAYMR